MSETNRKQQRAPFTKEGKCPPDVLAQIRGCTASDVLPALCGRRGSLAYLPKRAASRFIPLRDVPLSGIVRSFFPAHLEQDSKDNHALLYGDCKGARTNSNMHSMEAFPFDVDGGLSFEALAARIEACGIAALIYTTYTHGKTNTTIGVDRYEAFAKKAELPFPPTRESMIMYLKANRLGHLQNIAFDLSSANMSKHVITGEEMFYMVFHDPVDKVRLIVFLDEMMPLVGPQGVSVDGYKACYKAAARQLIGSDALELIDLSCSNPCQLIYLPAKPRGSTATHRILACDGKLWSWRSDWAGVSEELDARRAAIAERRRRFAATPQDLKVSQIADCLKHIPADDYLIWIRCLIAIFNETDGSDEGLRLAHDWSATVPDAYDEVELERKWNSFGTSSPGTDRIGLGSLVYLARLTAPEFRLERNGDDFDFSLIGL